MAVNRDKPDRWKSDITQSVDFYNTWFMEYAPRAYRQNREHTAEQVVSALSVTNNLLNISQGILKDHPEILPILRMSTCPPIARDRLVGLAKVSRTLVNAMEDPVNPRIPPRMNTIALQQQLDRIINIISRMADPDIFVWLCERRNGTVKEIQRASTVIADRLCGAVSDPIIRNAQEQRQLATIKCFLEKKGYRLLESNDDKHFDRMEPGTFSFRTNIPVKIAEAALTLVNIPVDIVIKPKNSKQNDFPLLFEAKSAGDFANVNKRRKEEATKMQQLRITYGPSVRFNLFLCGYFDSGYLGYEAAEGIDWVWEHRINDMNLFNI